MKKYNKYSFMVFYGIFSKLPKSREALAQKKQAY